MKISEAIEIPDMIRQARKETKEKIAQRGTLRTYQKGEMIFRDHEKVECFFFLMEGYITLYKINGNQNRKVVFIYGAGEMLNEVLVNEPKSSIHCEALSKVTVLCVPRQMFLEVMKEDVALTKGVLDSMSLKIRRAYRQLGNASNMMQLEGKVAAKLWKMAKDFGVQEEAGVRIDFELKITFLADMVGAKRESVSRVVHKMMEEGLMESEKNFFLIYDVDALKKLIQK